MKVICDHKDCTGCGLCAARCPKHCIEMKPGFLGHLYPVIDQEKCINCKLCQKGCPSLQYTGTTQMPHHRKYLLHNLEHPWPMPHKLSLVRRIKSK